MKINVFLGVSGVVVGDLGVRLYLDGSPVADPGITLTPMGALTDYVIDGLPDGDGTEDYTLTFEYPAGAYSVYRWGLTPYRPESVIVPIRVTGLDAAALELVVYRDDAEWAGTPALAELVPGGGDYLASGWPAPATGERWALRWAQAGLTYAATWWGAALPEAGDAHFMEIVARHRPFPTGLLDAAGRVVFSCNFDSVAWADLDGFEARVARLIHDAGYGTLGTDLFVGPTARIPDGAAGPYVSIVATGGFPADETHDGARYERPSFQILTRAKSYTVASERALAIWRALDGLRGVTVPA